MERTRGDEMACGERHDGGEEQEDAEPRSTKRQRMDQLIQMSLDFAGVYEHRPGNSTQVVDDTTADRDYVVRPSILLAGEDSMAPGGMQSSQPSSKVAGREIIRKRTWTPEEDQKLMELVRKLGRDWATIAREFPNRDRKRCRERFTNHLDPALSRTPWSADEDRQLIRVQVEMGSRWARIATQLTGRSPEDAKNRWLQLTDGDRRDGHAPPRRKPPQRWTIAETDALRSLVEANGAKDWFFIASQIPGRTDLQCRQHWYRVQAPTIIKGRGAWSLGEDEILLAKVDELGHEWGEIAAFLPGRLGKQCRERYLNQLDPSIVTGPWRTLEDDVLRHEYNQHPRKWSLIAKKLPGRTENDVKNHWNSIQRKSRNASPTYSGGTSRAENEPR